MDLRDTPPRSGFLHESRGSVRFLGEAAQATEQNDVSESTENEQGRLSVHCLEYAVPQKDCHGQVDEDRPQKFHSGNNSVENAGRNSDWRAYAGRLRWRAWRFSV